MVERDKAPHGYTYRATNVVNGKVYIGQTVTSRWKEGQIPIEERWKEEVEQAFGKASRGENLRYIENAIVKYGPDNFELKEEDVTHNQSELDAKEVKAIEDYDSMNPDKGYNLREGGRGGRLSEVAKDKLSKAMLKKYREDPEFRERIREIAKERAKDPEWRERMREIAKERAQDPEWLKKNTEINREKAKDPEYRKRLSEVGTKKYREDPEYQKKQTKERRERAKDLEWLRKMTDINRARGQDPEWRAKMREIGKQYRKEIPDKREFLKEIKGDMLKKDMLHKYDMGKNSFNKRIQEMFGHDGPRNFTELKDYMRDKNVGDVLKEIEERNKEREIKPESEGDDLKDKGESKSQDDLKEKTDKNTKSDEKEDLKERSKEENEDNKSDKNKENSEGNQNQENSDENLREKGEKSVEIEENIESKNKETMDEDTTKEEKENNVRDSEESKSKDSSNSEEEAKFGKNVGDMENLNITVKDYDGIDKNSSEREQDITCLDKDQSTKNSESTKYIDLGNADIVSIEIVKDIKTDENKDYKDIDEGAKKEFPDYAFIDNFLDNTKGNEESKSDKRIERGKEYTHT